MMGNPDNLTDILHFYNEQIQSSKLRELVGNDEMDNMVIGLKEGIDDSEADDEGLKSHVMDRKEWKPHKDMYAQPSDLEDLLRSVESAIHSAPERLPAETFESLKAAHTPAMENDGFFGLKLIKTNLINILKSSRS